MLTISQFIKPDMEVARSVNLERDAGSIDIVNDYQVTDKTREVLSRFGDALLGEKISAWSLTGPYGMGKSSFINYLLALTSPSNTDLANNACRSLKNLIQSFEKLFAVSTGNAWPGIFANTSNCFLISVNTSIIKGLKNALSLAEHS